MSMAKILLQKCWKYGLLFIFGICLALYFSYYMQGTVHERLIYTVELTTQAKASKPIVLDTAQQGLPKKIGQPDLVTITAGTVKNLSDSNLDVIVQITGFNDRAKLQASNKNPLLPDGTLAINLPPHKSLRNYPQLEVVIPPRNAEHYLLSQGLIRFVGKDGKLLTEIPVQIVNSNYSI